jgi:hypothetical protein
VVLSSGMFVTEPRYSKCGIFLLSCVFIRSLYKILKVNAHRWKNLARPPVCLHFIRIYIVTNSWPTITRSKTDEWIYLHLFTVNCNSSHFDLPLNSVWRISPLILEWTPFYNGQAAGIEVTMSNSSSVILCCHGNALPIFLAAETSAR